MQKNTPVPHLNKGISCQEKGDKNSFAVLSRVAKLRSVVAKATPGHSLSLSLGSDCIGLAYEAVT